MNWFPISPTDRTDAVKKVTVTDIESSVLRLGLGVSTQTETIFSSIYEKNRTLAYDNNFMNSVTYEIDTT